MSADTRKKDAQKRKGNSGRISPSKAEKTSKGRKTGDACLFLLELKYMDIYGYGYMDTF